MKRYALMIAAALMIGGVCITENSLQAQRPLESAPSGQSSIYALAGQFRVVFANLLWIKAEQYHHEYIENHKHWAQNKELLGLIRLITDIDPCFEEAYSVGAMIYSDGFKDPHQAISYALTGLTNNPKSYELNKTVAILYARNLDDPARGIPYAKDALKCCTDGFYQSSTKRLIHSLQRMAKEKETSATHTQSE